MIAPASAELDDLANAFEEYLESFPDWTPFEHQVEHITQLLYELQVIDEDVVESTNIAVKLIDEMFNDVEPSGNGLLMAGVARIAREGNRLRASYRCPVSVAQDVTAWSRSRRNAAKGIYTARPESDHEADALATRLLRVQIYAASFYYRAHRFIKLVGDFPGLKPKHEHLRIMIVRNQLIDHVVDDKPPRAWKWRFAVDSEAGAIFETSDQFKDDGFVHNRTEFLLEMAKRLRLDLQGTGGGR